MLSNCPHCREEIILTEAQTAKIQKALSALPAGKKLTLACQHCRQRMALDREGNVGGGAKQAEAGRREVTVKPPAPPDTDWIYDDSFTEDEKMEDIPMALVLHPSPPQRQNLARALEQMGYKTFSVSEVDDALEKMRFINFACVVMHSRFGGKGLDDNPFHQTMRRMPMSRRRYIFYILIGPEFHTLYDLQALAGSANLTINDQDIDKFGLVMRKAIPAYEELFAPIMEELGVYGRK